MAVEDKILELAVEKENGSGNSFSFCENESVAFDTSIE